MEFVLQHMHEMFRTRTSQEGNDVVANSRKNPLEAWRRLHERYDPTGEEGKVIFFAQSFLLDDALSRKSKRELNAGIPMVRDTRR